MSEIILKHACLPARQGLIGLKDYTDKGKSVLSIHPWKSVIQTNDIKANLKVLGYA